MERLDSNQYQGMVEDQDNTSNAPKAKKSIRITTTDNNLERLVEITKLISKKMRGAFNKMYGRILDLLDISVKTPVISALAQFWSSDLHCFELPNLDLVPTIEEYMRMMRLPIDDNIGVCGDFANVPLMGPRGCVTYTPSIALRQLNGPKSNPWKSNWETGSELHGRVSKGKEMMNWGNHEYLPHKGSPRVHPKRNPHGEGSSRSSDEVLNPWHLSWKEQEHR
ncbi:hypothetical protein SESBI_24349 [Sesbania bispinosa]|nr:hypothetical protein SESBI_24349 [Sesbania bispinosa]